MFKAVTSCARTSYSPTGITKGPVEMTYAWRALVVRRNRNHFVLYWQLETGKFQVFDGLEEPSIVVITMKTMAKVAENVDHETTLIVYKKVFVRIFLSFPFFSLSSFYVVCRQVRIFNK